MIDKRPIRLYYFSGTGNTEKVVFRFANRIKERGFNIDLLKIDDKPDLVEGDYILGLAFPIAVASTYPLVWDFFKKLPPGEGRSVFMIDTLAGFSGGIVGPLKRVLNKKGYKCIGAKEIIMPSNLNTSVKKQEGFSKIAEKGYLKAEKYADDLLEGKTCWLRVPLFSDITGLMSQSKNPWKHMSKMISCGDECVGCGRCIKECPTDSMTLEDNKITINTGRCNVCMRCFRICKTGALKYNNKKVELL